MDFSQINAVNTSALETLVAKTVDVVTNYSPATLFFLKNQKVWSGTRMRMPIKYQQNTQGISFNGLEQFSTTKSDNFINMQFDATGREIPVVISQMEVDVSESNNVIDMVKRQMSSDAQDMASDIATLFYTLQTGKNFLSIIDGVDDGTLGATSYGGLLRANYPGINGNVTTGVGLITLATLRAAMSAATHGSAKPNLILTTKAVWGYIEKLYTPTISTQIMQTGLMGYPSFVGATPNGVPNIVAPGTPLKGAQGFSALYFDGVPVIADENCPTGYLIGLNTNDWGFYGLKSAHPEYKQVTFFSDSSIEGPYNVPFTPGFNFSGFNTPIDQYGRVGHIILMGNLICRNPRNQFILTGITGA